MYLIIVTFFTYYFRRHIVKNFTTDSWLWCKSRGKTSTRLVQLNVIKKRIKRTAILWDKSLCDRCGGRSHNFDWLILNLINKFNFKGTFFANNFQRHIVKSLLQTVEYDVRIEGYYRRYKCSCIYTKKEWKELLS
jgi:hypothetical protein